MKSLVFVTEARFVQDANGLINGNSSFSNTLWERYLQVFDEVIVMARVKEDLSYIGDPGFIIDSPRISFVKLPYYIGPLQYLKNRNAVKKAINDAVDKFIECEYICRIPGQLGNLVISTLRKKSKSYSVEVVGDPDDVFAPGAVKHPLRAYFRLRMVQSLKENIRNAKAVLYVTKKVLQKKYPPSESAFVTYASNVRLPATQAPAEAKKWIKKNKINLVSIGSLEQMYKAPDVLLQALKKLNQNQIGREYKLTWIGDGKFKSAMIQLGYDLHINKDLLFTGNLDTNQVYKYLHDADVFILASRTEGLPRAVIEAMSVGLPIVGTRVGGIPELIDEEALVDKDEVDQLVALVEKIITDEDFYNKQAARNLIESKDYQEELLRRRRFSFYRYIVED